MSRTPLPSDIATVSAPIAVDLAVKLRHEGIDLEPLFEQAGIDFKAIDDPYQRIRLDRFTHLLELAAQLTDKPNLGLELGSRQNPAKWGAFGYVVLNSPTVGSALSNMARFLKPAQGGTLMAYVRKDNQISIEYSILHPRVKHKEQDAEFAMAYVKHVVEQLCGTSVQPESVYFEHSPMSELGLYEKLFGVTPYFDQPVNTISFSKALEDRPVPSADLQLYPIIKHHLIDLENSTPDDLDLRAQVAYQIRQLLPGGGCRLETVANALAVGPRTLQRQLQRQRCSFGEVLDQTRRSLALQHIEAATLEVKEISYLLGFSDSSHFIRAFKGWTGETPMRYRQAVLRIR